MPWIPEPLSHRLWTKGRRNFYWDMKLKMRVLDMYVRHSILNLDLLGLETVILVMSSPESSILGGWRESSGFPGEIFWIGVHSQILSTQGRSFEYGAGNLHVSYFEGTWFTNLKETVRRPWDASPNVSPQ